MDNCIGVTCQNGGQCQDRDNSYVCDCAEGYVGEHCEHGENHNCITNIWPNNCESIIQRNYTEKYCFPT